MYNTSDILETITMIQDEHLDIRTITMGISLLDCADSDIQRSCEKVYNKIVTRAENLVSVGRILSANTGFPLLIKESRSRPSPCWRGPREGIRCFMPRLWTGRPKK